MTKKEQEKKKIEDTMKALLPSAPVPTPTKPE